MKAFLLNLSLLDLRNASEIVKDLGIYKAIIPRLIVRVETNEF